MLYSVQFDVDICSIAPYNGVDQTHITGVERMGRKLVTPINPLKSHCSAKTKAKALDTNALFAHFDPRTGALDGAAYLERRLSDLRGCFADMQAYDDALTQGDPLVYRVASLE